MTQDDDDQLKQQWPMTVFFLLKSFFLNKQLNIQTFFDFEHILHMSR